MVLIIFKLNVRCVVVKTPKILNFVKYVGHYLNLKIIMKFNLILMKKFILKLQNKIMLNLMKKAYLKLNIKIKVNPIILVQ